MWRPAAVNRRRGRRGLRWRRRGRPQRRKPIRHRQPKRRRPTRSRLLRRLPALHDRVRDVVTAADASHWALPATAAVAHNPGGLADAAEAGVCDSIVAPQAAGATVNVGDQWGRWVERHLDIPADAALGWRARLRPSQAEGHLPRGAMLGTTELAAAGSAKLQAGCRRSCQQGREPSRADLRRDGTTLAFGDLVGAVAAGLPAPGQQPATPSIRASATRPAALHHHHLGALDAHAGCGRVRAMGALILTPGEVPPERDHPLLAVASVWSPRLPQEVTVLLRPAVDDTVAAEEAVAGSRASLLAGAIHGATQEHRLGPAEASPARVPPNIAT